MLKRDALLEIRIENIPARFVISAEEQLKKYAAELLAGANLPFESLEACGTYKRLVLYISGVPAKTEEKTQRSYGPAARLLKDEKGNFTPQAAGFARSRGTTPDKLGVETVPGKGEVLVFETKLSGRASVKALAEIFPQLISKLQFPKNMVWEKTRFRFARPIRSLLALYGDKQVAFGVAGIKSGRVTVGLSAKGSRQLKVSSAEKYFRTLENANVIVRDADRLEMLRLEMGRLAKRMKLNIDVDPELLNENLYLVEYPVCVMSDYSQDFLELPCELIHLVMKKQLKFFTVTNAKGVLQPYFVGIRDGVSKGQRNVEEGFKNVLEARFRDAIFFYTRDLATPISAMTAKLSEITFQEKLGSMQDKTARVVAFADLFCERMDTVVNREEVKQAADYVYADLSSNVVREFPELQGVMGAYYADNAKLPEAVVEAVGEFYLPTSANSPLPSSLMSSVVSMAGKVDNLASDFFLGLIPSGSADPHGLRRQAMGIVRIIMENEIRINLKEILEGVPAIVPLDSKPILDFIWQRAEVFFEEKSYRYDEVKAARRFFLVNGDLYDCRDRIVAIHALRNMGEKAQGFEAIIISYKRVKNIVDRTRNDLTGIPDVSLFDTPEEQSLYNLITSLTLALKKRQSQKDYLGGLMELLDVGAPLNNFFEEVMVMVDDPNVRYNRLNLMQSLVNLFDDVADLSQLQ